MTLERLLGLYVDGPATIVGIPVPAIEKGRRAEINVIDPAAAVDVHPVAFRSRSRNCPFKGRRLRGRVVCVVAGRRFQRF